jgi:8-hydroxy-5-deazaflavin:NADPH oxidoreductase
VKTIAVLGGTGNEGPGLALRWMKAGYDVIIGSRQAERAQQTADELRVRFEGGAVRGLSNADAAAACDVAVLTVPYAAQAALLEDLKDLLQGKLLISAVVALQPPKVSQVYVPPGGSALAEAHQTLGDGVPVAAAFQNVGASHLEDPDEPVDCDVLVCGQKDAKAAALELVAAAGMHGIDAGGISNAVVVEGLTSVLIAINIKHKVKGSGIRITGL